MTSMQVAAPDGAVRSTAPGASGGPAPSAAVLGVLLALLTISIWVGWFISTRYLVKTSLTTEDIVALRFGVGGIVLLPVALRCYPRILQMPLWKFAVIAIGAGAPYVLVTAGGLNFAPASHAAALTPGVMPLFVALLSIVLLKEQMSASRKGGFLLILLGVLCVAGLGVFAGEPGEWKGHLLFLLGAFMWACYTLALRGSGLSPIEVTAIVCVSSLIGYVPAYAIWSGERLLSLPTADIVFNGFYQGVLTGVISLICYAKAIELLGASRAAAFASLIPVLTLLSAIPLLGEMPTLVDVAGIVLVSAGVFLATGASALRQPRP